MGGETMKQEMYKDKNNGYFTATRMDIIQLLPKNKDNKILEIGAGNGATLLAAKSLGLAKETVGIELVKVDNYSENFPNIDKFIYGDIESIKLDFEENYFDVIICADVLEHLVNPWETIKKLGRFQKEGGIFLSSIPNIRNYRILRSIILGGDFRYQDGGILDRTHLRFFCKKNIIQMFEDNDYEIIKINTNMGAYGLKQKFLNNLTLKIFDDFFVFQYCTVARKK